MSRSQPTLTSPVTKFFRWYGKEGKLAHYDKEAEKEVKVKLPFRFLVLDELATIAGYSNDDQSGFWSNEVRSVAHEEFTVRTSKGTKEVGLYKDLAYSKSKGAKYAKSIYIAYEEGDEHVIGNFKATGAALTTWIDFSKKNRVMNGAVVLKGSEEAKKGATVYFVPIFEYVPVTPEENDRAIELDKQLQIYLSQYLSKQLRDREGQQESLDEFFPLSDEYSNIDPEEEMPGDFLNYDNN
jgi:hypothetical protein